MNVEVQVGCAGCAPHIPHFGRCFSFDRCECEVEEPPLPFKEERGNPDDSAHEDWEETGETGSLFVQEIERDHERD